jgi:hypothetical protein
MNFEVSSRGENSTDWTSVSNQMISYKLRLANFSQLVDVIVAIIPVFVPNMKVESSLEKSADVTYYPSKLKTP